MKKEFLSYDVVRDNGIILARKIYDDGFVPDVIYVPLRGGAYLGNIISEFLKIANKDKPPFLYAAVIANSYTGFQQEDRVAVHGWTYPPEKLNQNTRVLIVDDIFDSGATINSLVADFITHDVSRKNIKIAVHDYKIFHEQKEPLPIQPDYWCRKHDVYSENDNVWIHYLSHELIGLTAEELETYYFSKNQRLRAAFDGICP